MKKLKTLLALLSLLVFSSCALKPIVSEYSFVKTNFEKVELDKLGNGNVMIYNGADILHKIDVTARLNIWINGKALGQIKPSEYVILNLKEGEYEFKILHIDVVNMRSTHKLKIDKNTKVIKVKPTITSNKAIITNELPKRMHKFKYVKEK